MAQEEPEFYLTGQVIATYIEVRLIPQDFGALHLNIFDQPTRELFLKSANLYQKEEGQTREIWLIANSLWPMAYGLRQYFRT